MNVEHAQKIRPYEAGPLPVLTLPSNDAENEVAVTLWKPHHRKVSLPHLALRRLKVFSKARKFPPYRALRFQDRGAKRWALYFCYSPDGTVHSRHRFTIDRLREEGFSILLVCASSAPDNIAAFADLPVEGLIWKALPGYDFSGYTIGLRLLAERVDVCDVLVMNDSVLGPFHPVLPLLDSSPWRLTGFASSGAVENHTQSFAFHIRDLDLELWPVLRRVFFSRFCFNEQGPVSLLQETRLASALASSIPVGSIVNPPDEDPDYYLPLANPAGLLGAGFPFLKMSIFTKFSDNFDLAFYRDILEETGHPALG